MSDTWRVEPGATPVPGLMSFPTSPALEAFGVRLFPTVGDDIMALGGELAGDAFAEEV